LVSSIWLPKPKLDGSNVAIGDTPAPVIGTDSGLALVLSTANAEGALGECLTTEKRFAEAEPLLLRSYAETKNNLGEQDSRTMEAHQRLKILYEAWHKPERAALFDLR
jgi:hypothetical protein